MVIDNIGVDSEDAEVQDSESQVKTDVAAARASQGKTLESSSKGVKHTLFTDFADSNHVENIIHGRHPVIIGLLSLNFCNKILSAFRVRSILLLALLHELVQEVAKVELVLVQVDVDGDRCDDSRLCQEDHGDGLEVKLVVGRGEGDGELPSSEERDREKKDKHVRHLEAVVVPLDLHHDEHEGNHGRADKQD